MARVEVIRLASARDLALPSYATEGAAGMDLYAAVPEDAPMRLGPGERAAISTGLRVAIPPGFEGQIRARSGRALREGLAMLNAPGTIDSDFRGELKVIAINLGADVIEIRRGERVAQLVIAPVERAAVAEVDEFTLAETPRGERGFGSTGR